MNSSLAGQIHGADITQGAHRRCIYLLLMSPPWYVMIME